MSATSPTTRPSARPGTRPSTRPSTRRAAVGVAVLALLVGAACGDEDGDDDGAAGAAADDATERAPDTFRARTALACTEAINARGPGFTDGRDAMLDALVAQVEGEVLSAQTVDIELVQGVADELGATSEALSEVDTADATEDEAAAWETVIADVDERQASVEARVTALDGGDPAAIEAAFAPLAPLAVDEAAIETLGQLGLDCSRLLDQVGPSDAFERDAATACAVAVQILREPDVLAARESVLSVVGDAAAGGVTDLDDARARSGDAETVATATRAAADVVDGVDADAGRAGSWGLLTDAVTARADAEEARADALRDGDADEIDAAFAPGAGVGIANPGTVSDALVELALDQRDCGSLTI